MHGELPDKLYFKIGEVAKYADVAPHVIRYWESEFDTIRPKRANSRQRLFRREDVLIILGIKDLLHNKGYTIAGAKKYLAENGNRQSAYEVAEKKQSKGSPEAIEKLQSIKNELLKIKDMLH